MLLLEENVFLYENVYLNTSKCRVGIRFTNKVAGTAKNHFNIKMFSKSSQDSIEVKLDKSTIVVDREATEASIRSKEKEKFYKKNIDELAGALHYSKKEVSEYFEKENRDAADTSHNAIEEKFKEFMELDPKEKQRYIDEAKELSKKLNESSNFIRSLNYIDV